MICSAENQLISLFALTIQRKWVNRQGEEKFFELSGIQNKDLWISSPLHCLKPLLYPTTELSIRVVTYNRALLYVPLNVSDGPLIVKVNLPVVDTIHLKKKILRCKFAIVHYHKEVFNI